MMMIVVSNKQRHATISLKYVPVPGKVSYKEIPPSTMAAAAAEGGREGVSEVQLAQTACMLDH